MKLDIRNASINEINLMSQWAAEEGWCPGVEDVHSYYLIDPNSFYAGYIDNKMVASVSCVTYSEHYSFLGYYIVRPEYRFKTLGYQIAQYLKQQITTQNHTFAIDGVVARIPKYEKMGFTLAHSNIRYQLLSGTPLSSLPQYVMPIGAIPLNEIATYDKQVFPSNRFGFLMSWLTQSQTQAFAYYDGSLKGFGAIRPAVNSYRIGPLFADTAEIAASLLKQLCAAVSLEQPIYIDVPTCNTAAVKLCESLNMQPTFETGRMYHGIPPQLATDKIFGLTSLEVG